MTCSAFVRYKGFHYSKAIIFLDRVDFRNKRKKGQHLNSLCAVSTLPKGKNKIERLGGFDRFHEFDGTNDNSDDQT